MTRIEQLRKIVADKQYAEVEGQVVDLFTASAIMACYDAGSERTKKIIATAPLLKVAEVAWKVVKF